jgi:hypothetical protein
MQTQPKFGRRGDEIVLVNSIRGHQSGYKATIEASRIEPDGRTVYLIRRPRAVDRVKHFACEREDFEVTRRPPAFV